MIKDLGDKVENISQQLIDSKIYLMDYKFMNVKNSLEEEDSEEIGRINFQILNKPYPHLKNFLREQLFENLVLMLVLDLSKPSEVSHEFIQWISYINQQVMPFIMEMKNQAIRDKMNHNFTHFFQKNQ